eukprot:936201-Rhodomonas_salina.1
MVDDSGVGSGLGSGVEGCAVVDDELLVGATVVVDDKLLVGASVVVDDEMRVLKSLPLEIEDDPDMP